MTPNASAFLPPADRAWTAGDCEAAAALFARLPREKLPTSLPEPSAVFARMINPQNLEPLRDQQDSMSHCMTDTRRYLIATARITS